MKTPHLIACIFASALVLWVLFGDQFWRWRQKLRDARNIKKLSPHEQAVIVHLRRTGLPEEIYEKYDISTLQDQLREAIVRQEVGEFDGNEIGPEEATLYMYGADAERLFEVVEPVLRAYPLSREGFVVIRRGPPGSPEREVSLHETKDRG